MVFTINMEKMHPILPIELQQNIYDKYGEEAAVQTLQDVQDGIISVETFEKYWRDDDPRIDMKMVWYNYFNNYNQVWR